MNPSTLNLTVTQPGSLSLIPKRGHTHGDGDDSTRTRARKAAAMRGIDLILPRRKPVHSMTGIVRGAVLGLGLWVIIGATALMLWRAW